MAATGPALCRRCSAGIRRSGRMPVVVYHWRRGVPRRALAAALILGAVACERGREGSGAADRDDFGHQVVRGSATAPARIVSLNPATTEILFALGVGSRVIGRSRWDQWPAAARAVAEVGDGIRPNVEAVLARRPDLVVLYASADNRQAAERLRAAGVRTLALKVDRISEFRRAVRILGDATGAAVHATVVVDSVDRTIAQVRAATSDLPHPSVFWHVWDAPVITIGAGSFLHELVEIAGARNVYADLRQPSPQVTLEDVARRDPDMVLAGAAGAAHITRAPAWSAVRAVREGRVVVVDTALVGRPSVNLGAAAVSLARLIHPGALP